MVWVNFMCLDLVTRDQLEILLADHEFFTAGELQNSQRPQSKRRQITKTHSPKVNKVEDTVGYHVRQLMKQKPLLNQRKILDEDFYPMSSNEGCTVSEDYINSICNKHTWALGFGLHLGVAFICCFVYGK